MDEEIQKPPKARIWQRLKPGEKSYKDLRVYWFPKMGEPVIRMAKRDGENFGVDDGTYHIREGSERWIRGHSTVIAFEGIAETISLDLLQNRNATARDYDSFIEQHIVRELNENIAGNKTFARDVLPWIICGIMLLQTLILFFMVNGLGDQIDELTRYLAGGTKIPGEV